MKFGLSNEDIKIINDVFKEFPEIEKVIIFGSRALNTFKPASDVDFALKGKINLDIVAKVKRILDEERPLPYFFDIVDYNSISNPELKKHIDGHGKIFYLKK